MKQEPDITHPTGHPTAQPLHSWDLDLAEARLMQQKLAACLHFPIQHAEFRWIAGADVACDQTNRKMIAAVVLFDMQSGFIVEKHHAIREARFPYVPGFLSFREAPAVLDAWNLFSQKPEVLILDGQGWAHPRRFGLACHLGLWLGVASIGCAKSRLIGEYDEPGREAGSQADLCDRGGRIGVVLRTRKKVKPVFISQGNLLTLPVCIQLVLHCCRGYRLPEPTRQAHLLVTRLRREISITA